MKTVSHAWRREANDGATIRCFVPCSSVQAQRADEKAVSYIRGPVVLGMYFEVLFPGIFWFGTLVPLVWAVIVLIGRLFLEPEPVQPKAEPTGPRPYKPRFKVERRE